MTAKSSPTDLVSESDVAAETLIRRWLADHRPDDAIVGEEGDDTAGTSGRRWVVDPLDGTTNYLYGNPQWGVSVALTDDAGGLVGVVFDPMRDELWSGARDAGPPRLDGVPVTARGVEALDRALVATGFGYDAGVRAVQGARIAALAPRVRDLRRAGAAAIDLAWVAGGRLDAYFERGVKAWDVAAGSLLCELAGCDVCDLAPEPPAAAGVLAAPPTIAAELLAIVG